MFSPREMAYDKLPSRIWINEHLTFTHGYGLVVGPVNRIFKRSTICNRPQTTASILEI